MAHHRSDLKRGKYITSKYILELGDYEIVLLELYPCNSKDELHARERHYIEKLDCVNRLIPFRSKEEKIEYKKKWHIENKEIIYKQHAQYYQNNKEALSKQQKEYRELNKDKIKAYVKDYTLKNKEKVQAYQKEHYLKNKEKRSEYNKEYKLKNKEKRNEYDKVKITCECGCLINRGNISTHKKSKKHLDLLQSSL